VPKPKGTISDQVPEDGRDRPEGNKPELTAHTAPAGAGNRHPRPGEWAQILLECRVVAVLGMEIAGFGKLRGTRHDLQNPGIEILGLASLVLRDG